MKKYLEPLITFGLGSAAILFGGLFLPAINTETTTMAASISSISSDFWGLPWVITSVRALYYVGLWLVLLYIVAKQFLGLNKR